MVHLRPGGIIAWQTAQVLDRSITAATADMARVRFAPYDRPIELHRLGRSGIPAQAMEIISTVPLAGDVQEPIREPRTILLVESRKGI
jgi:hypothetical protein